MYMQRMRYTWTIALCSLALTPLIASAWTGPTASPPNGNVAAPINVGTTAQVKNGGLGVNTLTVFGNSLFGGSTGSNAYLNFGDTSGVNGYGIRDNNGLLEFKNSSSTWQSLQSVLWTLCGGPCGGASASWTSSGNNIYNTNTGNVGINTTNPGYKLTVTGVADTWAQVVNWPPGSVNGYGILVGNGSGKYSQFQNAEGYYTLIPYSSYGAYTNGNMYASNYYIAAIGKWASQMNTPPVQFGPVYLIYPNKGSADCGGNMVTGFYLTQDYGVGGYYVSSMYCRAIYYL